MLKIKDLKEIPLMEKSNYRALLFFASFLTIITIFTSCGSDEESGTDRKVVWWYETTPPENQDFIHEKLRIPFNESQDDYELIVEFKQDIVKETQVAVLANKGPDIIFTPGAAFTARLVKANKLEPLDGYARQFGWNDRILKPLLDSGQIEGQLYSLPKTTESLGMFYNKRVFEENGWSIPQNIQDIYALSDSAEEKGMYGIAVGNNVWRPSNEHYVTVFLTHYAGPDNVFKALSGQTAWTNPVFVSMLTEMKKWWDEEIFTSKDYFSIGGEDQIRMVADREAAIAMTGTWAFQWLATYFEDINDAGFAAFPPLRDGLPENMFSLGIGANFSINGSSKVKDGAALILDNIMTGESYANMTSVWPGEWNIPVKDIPSDVPGILPAYAKFVRDMSESLDNGSFGFTTWSFFPEATQNAFIDEIEKVWLNEETPAGMMTKIENIFKEELAKGLVPPLPEPVGF